MRLKLPKSSTILFINILILLIFTIFVYILLYKNLTLNKTKNQEVIFYQLKEKTFTIFKKVFQEHSLMKDTIFEKNINLSTISSNSLDELYENLNENLSNKPFNIYLLDKNCILVEQKISTTKPYFNEDYCKNTILQHKNISNPTFIEDIFTFQSYINYYLEDKEQILQLAYNFTNFVKDFEELKDFTVTNDDIFAYELFTNFQDKINHFTFKKNEKVKSYIDNIDINSFKSISNHSYQKVGEDYLHTVYFSQNSPIISNRELFFHIIFNENTYNKDILYIRFLSVFIFVIGTLTIYLIYKIRTIELLLNYKDKFIAHSIHEIKTPLSIISINTQLREKLYGSDKYTKKIDGALKTLENSYEDMTFLHTKDKITYEIVKINLQRALENRVSYFDTIAVTQNRKIKLEIDNNFYVNMGKIELNRLVDNNISNAIKYSYIDSTIIISLRNNVLEFISNGNEIQNPKRIFKRYAREDKTTGGHGLGLAIVSDICKKYGYKIEVTSKENINTFRYILL